MSLTHVAVQTRMLVVAGISTLIFLIVGTFLFNATREFLANRNPPPPPMPTYGFGLLPPIQFPSQNTNQFTYKLETVGGFIPSIEAPFMPVYLITNIKPPSGFFQPERAREKAAALQFILEPQLIEGTMYRWNRTNPIPAVLNLDMPNNRFDFSVAWETDPGFLSHTTRPTPDQAISEIKSILRSAGFLPDDLNNGRAQTTLLYYESGEFKEALSLADTKFIQVDLFRNNIEFNLKSYPIISADPEKGLARGLVSSVRTQGKRIVSLEYYHETIDYINFQTYPFITGPEAWQFLNSGYGYVANPPSNGATEAVVRRTYIAYYDPLDDSQQFLQPVYVFVGDNDFVAYVPAIHPMGLQPTTATNN